MIRSISTFVWQLCQSVTWLARSWRLCGQSLFGMLAIVTLGVSGGVVKADLQQPVTWSQQSIPISWTGSKECSLELKVAIAPGWKIYAPDHKQATGLPTQALWPDSHNVQHVQIHWPKPLVFPQSQGQPSIEGYETSLTIPLTVWLQDHHQGLLKVKVTGLACSDMCSPFLLEKNIVLNPAPLTWSTWLTIALFAFLGGAILNIMPCVLPVLALKLKGLLGPDPRRMRALFRWTIGGIFLGFWALAGTTMIIKYIFQGQIGWGMHLRNPYFLAIMMMILMIAGCGLLGLFHIQTPAWAGRLLNTHNTQRSPERMALLSGLVAVWLATPCSAPFLGSAVGFALTSHWSEMLFLFTLMAAGFATPYLVGLVAPVWKWLPKPGPWMERVERAMGIMMLLSAGWFLWFGYRGLIKSPWHHIACILWVVWSIGPWLLWSWRSRRWYRWVVYGLPMLIGSGWLVFPSLSGTDHYAVSMKDGAIDWQPWSENAVKKALAEGRTVVIDITGLACPLCIVNKRVFAQATVQDKLTKPYVVCLRGDFSHADPQIFRFLSRYERVAIPFNVIIGPQAQKGIVLSERLTSHELLQAVDQASQQQDTSHAS